MAMVVRSNVASVFAQNRLNKAQISFNGSLERLASGSRINRAADDSAGLAISTTMEHRLVGQNAARQNAQEGVSLLQTAEGGMNQIGGMLDRMRELAVRSSSGTLNSTDRTNADLEYQQLVLEVDRIAGNTEFNGTKLLNGSLDVDIQVGFKSGASNKIDVVVDGLSVATIMGAAAVDVQTATKALVEIDKLDTAIGNLNTRRSSLGSLQNRLERAIGNLDSDIENTTAANSRIRDVDFASETADFTRSQILIQSGTAILSQANSAPQAALSLLG